MPVEIGCLFFTSVFADVFLHFLSHTLLLETLSEAQGMLPAIHLVADGVRIAGVLLEGGFEKDPVVKTEALLLWHLGVNGATFVQ